jgi:hypothetical protein
VSFCDEHSTFFYRRKLKCMHIFSRPFSSWFAVISLAIFFLWEILYWIPAYCDTSPSSWEYFRYKWWNFVWAVWYIFMNLHVLPLDDQKGHVVQGMNCLRFLERWDRGFESHSKHGCLYAFILCFACASSGLSAGWPRAWGVLPSVYRIFYSPPLPRCSRFWSIGLSFLSFLIRDSR